MANIVYVSTGNEGIRLFSNPNCPDEFDFENGISGPEWKLFWDEKEYCEEKFGDDVEAEENWFEDDAQNSPNSDRSRLIANLVKGKNPDFVVDPEAGFSYPTTFDVWEGHPSD